MNSPSTPKQKTVEVPRKWLEGLLEAAKKVDDESPRLLLLLLGYIDSAKQLLK